MTVRGLALAAVLTASMPVDVAAQCHRYAVWRYPWPQRCGVAHGNGRDMLVRLARLPDRPQMARHAGPQVDAAPVAPAPDIPVPALGPVEEVEADDATAWLMLRMMENAHGH